MTRYLLDTSFVIDHLRGDPAATARFAQLFADGDDVMINEIVACEAWAGAPLTGDPALTQLMQAIEFVQPGPEGARRAGVWRQEARRRGHVLSLADALVAAAADPDATVLTRNVRDFSLTPVRVEAY